VSVNPPDGGFIVMIKRGGGGGGGWVDADSSHQIRRCAGLQLLAANPSKHQIMQIVDRILQNAKLPCESSPTLNSLANLPQRQTHKRILQPPGNRALVSEQNACSR